MIKDLDLTLQAMLVTEAEPGQELHSAALSFSVPDEKWQSVGTGLALNIYLYDIRENRALRTNEVTRVYNDDGTISLEKASPRISCAYIITAWDKSNTTNLEHKIQTEHRLLGQVLRIFLAHPTIPPHYLQGSLVGQHPDLPSVFQQKDGLPHPVEFWNALGSPLKPSLNFVVTFSLDMQESPLKAPMVVSQVTRFGFPKSRALTGEDKKSPMTKYEDRFQIRGQVINELDHSKKIAGAVVTIQELGGKEAVTDSDGFYYFPNLQGGTYTLDVSAEGYTAKSVSITIPGTTNYIITLSAQ